MAEDDCFKVAVYGCHGIKEYKRVILIQNYGFILAIPRLSLTILIIKIMNHEIMSNTSGFFPQN